MRYLVVLIFICNLAYGENNQNSIDSVLSNYIRDFQISSPVSVLNNDPKKYKFGKLLFEDKVLSLANNVSCKTCHNDKFGTGDAIPFSIGVGGSGNGINRRQNLAGITSRNAPHLFNKAHSSFRGLFWDGRVSYNKRLNTYNTPEAKLNGENPEYSFISNKIDSLIAMQALFPLVNEIEMKGVLFPKFTNLMVWKELTRRVVENPKYLDYVFEGFNIADIANALAYFQKVEFQVNDTPLDHYISGKIDVLSKNEKKGAIIFFEKGRCARCHFGPLLSNRSFQSVSVPQIGPGQTKDKNDEGRFLVTKNVNDKYKFLTQPLRNISLTAPFFHNGAFNGLAEVVDHYNNPSQSIHNYDVGNLQNLFGTNYNEYIFVDRNQYNNFYRVQSLNNILKTPLRLSNIEKRNLVCFLKKSLTQEKFHNKINLDECEAKDLE